MADTMTDTEIAWCAGLFEGEGSLFVVNQPSKKKVNYQYIRMTLKMTDYDVVLRFASTVRVGTIRAQTPIGKRKQPSHYKRYYVWQLSNRTQVINLMTLLHRYLGARRRAKMVELGIVVNQG